MASSASANIGATMTSRNSASADQRYSAHQSFLPTAESTNSLDTPFSSHFERAASSDHPGMTSFASASSALADTSYADNEDEYGMQPEEHVVALHDFNSNNATCPHFKRARSSRSITVIRPDGGMASSTASAAGFPATT